ncbi:DUF2927 domain-containing protein [Roseinatronobacter alkalisoli]|uniref:DUF2927 domain-containing protein n=1 Tax=Roseinatronobacter alkalisoli TaxID=3028235 RepID=A0ABT5T5I4_9RHOB|nr:DUF2927 domain-containing protein [Roseinatronobacter sp. HJB301]MDD7970380.1 DUF2927 domain-containing protein [Roseinatronobacter sp. HJB301]
MLWARDPKFSGPGHWMRAQMPAVALLATLGACAPFMESQSPPAPPAQSVRPPAAPATEIETPSAPSSAVAAHFLRIEEQRLADGLLRTDPRPKDLPFAARDLEEVFVQVALHDEYTFSGNRLIERATPAPLRRWQKPVRMRLEFGDSVPASVQHSDTRLVSRFAARLGNLTGHPVSMTSGSANFHVLVLDEAERRAIGPRLRNLIPGIDQVTENIVTGMPLSVSCLVLAFSRSGTDVYTDAVAIIRAELPDLSRMACYHEELAQGMGLPNDSPRARPSLFNDAAEFAVLTAMDEYLLRIVYDPRLRPGIREREARPIIRSIVGELMGGES